MCTNWFKTQSQVNAIDNTQVKKKIPPVELKIERLDLAEAVDYSIDSSIVTGPSEDESFENENAVKKKQRQSIKLDRVQDKLGKI